MKFVQKLKELYFLLNIDKYPAEHMCRNIKDYNINRPSCTDSCGTKNLRIEIYTRILLRNARSSGQLSVRLRSDMRSVMRQRELLSSVFAPSPEQKQTRSARLPGRSVSEDEASHCGLYLGTCFDISVYISCKLSRLRYGLHSRLHSESPRFESWPGHLVP
jgi:hypothetical protein